MGLFGPKIPKEEKAFQKALKTALNKPNTQNIQQMKKVLMYYPKGWQGFWICAVYHDQGFDGVARDEAKAQEYFRKAEDAARGTDHEVWMREFLTWYRRPAGSLTKPMTAEVERARRLGIAMCYCSLLGGVFLQAPYEKYGDDNYLMSWKILMATGIDYDERRPIQEFLGVSTVDRNEQIKDTNKYFECANKSWDGFIKCGQQLREGKDPNWDKFFDLYDYFIGINCIHGGNLLTEEVAEKSDYLNETNMGIMRLVYGCVCGCQPAIHELTRLANGSRENHELIGRIFAGRTISKSWDGEIDRLLTEKLERCIAQNDAEAKQLYQMYYY